MNSTNLVPAMMSQIEARRCADSIKSHIDDARSLVLELYERQGWAALGYGSWRECVTKEFDQSKSHLYRQLEAAKIEREISPIGEKSIPESHLRPLAQLPEGKRAEAWKEAVEKTNGKPTAKAVQEVVNKRVGKEPPAHAEITEVEGDTVESIKEEQEERQAIVEEMSDADWLATLPLNSVLDGNSLKKFQADALLYRQSQQVRDKYKHSVEHIGINKVQSHRRGIAHHHLMQPLYLQNPKFWIRCPATADGGCGGVGMNTTFGTKCPSCFGRGYKPGIQPLRAK